MSFKEKTISRSLVKDCRIFKIADYEVMTVSGKIAHRYIIEHGGAAAIAALTPENRLLMIRQYRKALDEVIWEIPAGLTDDGDEGDTRRTAERELREETGYEAEDWQLLTSFFPTGGYSTEKIDIWLARTTDKGLTAFDDSEDIELYELEIPELLAMIDRGEIRDSKTIIAVEMTARRLGL